LESHAIRAILIRDEVVKIVHRWISFLLFRSIFASHFSPTPFGLFFVCLSAGLMGCCRNERDESEEEERIFAGFALLFNDDDDAPYE
jgi:hypothetical protein